MTADAIRLDAPVDDRGALTALRAGDRVLLSGVVYTARDAAHRRIVDLIDAGEELPFPLAGSVIYYCGPAPARPGHALGSAGPTSSYRMDPFAPTLLDHGLAGIIGKGPRSERVAEALRADDAVYFAATGGAGALLSHCVESSEVVAWPELGTEAVRRLRVRDMPLVVALDARGGDVYRDGPRAYLASRGLRQG
ncbi:MAG: Fe-S-containing hydro-lyase [Coriobacteriales bacterium]|jgi:fumarate hydratase subunit beta